MWPWWSWNGILSRIEQLMTGWLVASVGTVGDGTYFGWDGFSIQSGNLIVIVVMILLFVLALVLPFPGGKRRK
jgi:hypothetical protein